MKSTSVTFNTEPNFDFFKAGLDGFQPVAASGNLGAGWWFNVTTSASFQSNRATLEFISDASVTAPGIWLNQLEVCRFRTTPDTAPPNVLTARRRYNGVLLGTNDVVHYQFPAPFGGAQLGNHRITLWSDSGGNDFDLYARCNAMPTGAQYDYRSYSSDSQEYVSITGCAGTVYVAVSSYNGSGSFSLVRNFRKQDSPQVLTAGTDFSASAPETAMFTSQLRDSIRLFYGATEGEYAYKWVFNSTACTYANAPTKVCFTHQPGQRSTAVFGGQVTLRQDDWGNARTLRHELGHAVLWLPDEYADVNPGPISKSRCGHTIMSTNLTNTNNNFCVGLDHGKDYEAGQLPMTGVSGWETAFNNLSVTAYDNTTLDNFSYLNFDFNSQVGVN